MTEVEVLLLGERREPHTGLLNQDFAIYTCIYICVSIRLSCPKMRRRNYVAQTYA